MIRSLLTVAGAACLAALSPGAVQAEGIQFKGQTTANALLIKDVLVTVHQVTSAVQNCPTLGRVDARVLTKYQPLDTRYHAGDASEHYERWDVVACGKTTPFLIGFWPAVEGGTMFQVGYPYPKDAPK